MGFVKYVAFSVGLAGSILVSLVRLQPRPGLHFSWQNPALGKGRGFIMWGKGLCALIFAGTRLCVCVIGREEDREDVIDLVRIWGRFI